MKKDVAVKKSKISGRGVFALRDFEKGEIVLKWNPKIISKDEVSKLSLKQQGNVSHIGRRYFLMQLPEKYVNYSCESNTQTKNLCDIAKRKIKKGEEITSDYGKEGNNDFQCNCGSKKCKGIIR